LRRDDVGDMPGFMLFRLGASDYINPIQDMGMGPFAALDGAS
jgi:hypothetical protein